MHIVFANKYHYLRGGAERYVFDTSALLAKHGHEVVPFAMRDVKNEPTPWSKYFVSPVQTEKVSYSWSGLRTAGRAVYSFEARRKFGQLLGNFNADLVHVHNIYHQISPSILTEAKLRGIPVVMTAHDYAMIAPNYSLYHDGAICEVTRPDHFWRAVDHRCVKGSSAASAVDAVALRLQRMLGLWNIVDRIIAPSAFVQSLLHQYGVPAEKVVHVPHPMDVSGWVPTRGGQYVLYVGRLVPEKGVETLIRAAAMRRSLPVRIVGTGPDEGRLRELAAKLGANVEFRGWKSGAELKAEYQNARFVVVPSQWYEVFGLSVLEAYAAGKPVIASNIGALSELVHEGQTGLLSPTGDHEQLHQRLVALWDAPDAADHMGANARLMVEREFAPEKHYLRLMGVYASVGALGEKG